VLSVRMTPDWRKTASARMWASARRRADVESPVPRPANTMKLLFTARMGLCVETSRAMRMNRRGLPKDSR
jgi:hypothetical protein